MIDQDELRVRRRVAEEAARAGGEVHLRLRGSHLERTIHHGERSDFATLADMEAQQAVRDVVGRYFPGEPVIGEEDDSWVSIGELVQSGCWLTDPLDGTQDYVHGSPAFSCIVSYAERGEPRAAAVYFPAWQEMYAAARGQGSVLNGDRIHVSTVTRLEAAICSTAYRGSDPRRAEAFARRVATLLPHIESLRLPGAPSVMACAVASGRYDIFASFGQLLEGSPVRRPFPGQPWETAAFILLVQEAGGAVASLDGGPPDLLGHNTFAASQTLIDEYIQAMAQPGPPA
jgi:fructose-1,6-bisphosphatase/inositol monophosphatase family enzyme